MAAMAPRHQGYQSNHHHDYRHAYRQQHQQHQQRQQRHHQYQHQHAQYEQAPPLPPRPRQHQAQNHIAELEAPPCIAFEMPATPVEEEPCLRERPIATTTNNHHLNPRPSASRLSLSATSYPSTSSLHRDPSSIPLPPSRAVTPTPPDLTPSSSAVVSSSTLQTEDCPPTPLDCPPANYPQAKRPALKLFGSKKAKRWLDSTVDGTQGRLNTAVKPYVSNPRYNPKNWTTIAQAASHRYLEGKLYGPKGRYPHGEDVDEGVVGRPKLPARPGARAGAGAGAVVLAGEQEVAFPAVGLAPMVVRKKTR